MFTAPSRVSRTAFGPLALVVALAAAAVTPLLLVGAGPAYADFSSTVTNFDGAGNQVVRFDTDGNAVDAHDGDLLAVGGTYYLYGTSYNCGFAWQQSGAPFCGFRAYSSPDLVHWTDRGPLFDASTSTWQSRCNGDTYGCYRPHVVYNAGSGTYVLWINTYDVGVGFHVFTSDGPAGPFAEVDGPTLAVNATIPPGINNGDHDLFVDNDGTAYLAYTDWRAGGDIVIERLNSTYLSGTGSYVRIGQSTTEAPALFRRGSSYYLLYSDPNCGYCTTGTSYRRASSPLGPWSQSTNLTTDSCGGQPSFVATLGDTYLYASDLWNNAAPNEALANYYWTPLEFTGGDSILPINCNAAPTITLATGSTGTQSSPTDLDQDSGVTGFRTYCDIGGNIVRSQSFVASRNGQLTNVSFTSFQQGHPNSGLEIAVYAADSAGRPVNSALSTLTRPTSAIGWSPRNVTVQPDIPVTAGTRYAIVVSSSTNSGCYGLAYNDGAPYPGGGASYSGNGGVSYNTEAGRTLKFFTTVNGSGGNPPLTATASSSFDQCCGWSLNALTDEQDASTPSSMGWSSNSSLNANHTEWVRADLGVTRTINRVTLMPRSDAGNQGEGFPTDFTIETSVNGTSWTTVATRTGYSRPAAVAQDFNFAALSAHYVRVTGTSLRNTNPNDPRYRMQFAELRVA